MSAQSRRLTHPVDRHRSAASGGLTPYRPGGATSGSGREADIQCCTLRVSSGERFFDAGRGVTVAGGAVSARVEKPFTEEDLAIRAGNDNFAAQRRTFRRPRPSSKSDFSGAGQPATSRTIAGMDAAVSIRHQPQSGEWGPFPICPRLHPARGGGGDFQSIHRCRFNITFKGHYTRHAEAACIPIIYSVYVRCKSAKRSEMSGGTVVFQDRGTHHPAFGQ